MKKEIKTILLVSATLVATTATPAFAQEAAAKEDSAASDIIVTAQRRSENVQNVAIAITALSGESLAESGVAVQRDLQYAAPAITRMTRQSISTGQR